MENWKIREKNWEKNWKKLKKNRFFFGKIGKLENMENWKNWKKIEVAWGVPHRPPILYMHYAWFPF